MKLLATLLISVLALTSCSKKEPTPQYDLHIGGESVKLDISGDIAAMEKEALQQIMPLWNNLKSRESEWFSYSKTTPWQDFDGRTTAKGETITATTTSNSAQLRFFKHKNGESGIENKNGPITHWPADQHMSQHTVEELTKELLRQFQPILKSDLN